MNYYEHLKTPLGLMEVTANTSAITSIYFVERARPVNANAITKRAIRQLEEYFDGKRKEFELPLAADGTEFQHRVWTALQTVPYGETRSYGDIAVLIGNPKGMRAVGLANGKNPLTIVVPCHRIIGANGKLTGYASGTDRKAWLLNHEAPSLFDQGSNQV